MLHTNTTAKPKTRTPTTRTMFDAVNCHLWIGLIRLSAVYNISNAVHARHIQDVYL